ncbi:MAG: hypothetical protein F6K09_03515 [Merismopedia sp. SIO2A8]|nr:hypothetical protein [Merismopedia sp. SIO2A8]
MASPSSISIASVMLKAIAQKIHEVSVYRYIRYIMAIAVVMAIANF